MYQCFFPPIIFSDGVVLTSSKLIVIHLAYLYNVLRPVRITARQLLPLIADSMVAEFSLT